MSTISYILLAFFYMPASEKMKQAVNKRFLLTCREMKNLFIVCLVLLSGCRVDPVEESAANSSNCYFVDTAGNDNNSGTQFSPFHTIQRAVDLAKPGDTVFVKSGVYNQKVIIKSSGKPGKYISLKGYGESAPVIDGLGLVYSSQNYEQAPILGCFNVEYWQIAGITVKNSERSGISFLSGCSHILISNCNIDNCISSGIAFGADNGGVSSNIIVKNNKVTNCSKEQREAISLRGVNGFEIAYNTVENTPKEGVDAKSGSGNGSIHHNRISDAGAVGIYIDAGYRSIGVETVNIKVYQNTVINSKTSICVATEVDNDARNIYIYNNLVYDFPTKQNGVGIKLAEEEGSTGILSNIYIVNNTVYNKAQQGIYINNPRISGVFIANNISSNNWKPISVSSKVNSSLITFHNNLHHAGTIENKTDTDVSGDPMFEDVAAGNLRLKASSPAIDMGSANYANMVASDFDGILRPQGMGFDIGAFERR